MKKLVFILISLFSLGLHASGVYKCKDSDGKVTFSGMPCVNSDSDQEVIKSISDSTPSYSGVEPVEITNQAEFVQYVKNLRFKNISEVLSGVSKESFHGIDVRQLFSSNGIEYEDWNNGNEELEFLVSISENFKIFSVMQAVWVDGRGSHSFLDMETSEVVSAMSSKGFGKPKVLDFDQHWKWDLDGAKCDFSYSRSPHNPEKYFQYGCIKK